MDNKLISINSEDNRITISGRALHAALEVSTRYNDWFKRMCEYGFSEDSDFYSILSKTTDGGRPATDHQLTIDMAKELCMIQRTDKGKQCRQYFLEIEKKWNDPVNMMARSLVYANNQLTSANAQIKSLTTEVETLKGTVTEMQPKADYYDAVLDSSDAMTVTDLAKSLNVPSAQKLNKFLCSIGVQYKAKNGAHYLLYAKYMKCGYAKLRRVNGDRYFTDLQLVWTQKGREFIYNKLVETGYYD